MEMTVSDIRRMYSQSKNKMSELSILADLNGCSVEKIAELVADIPLEDEISKKRIEGMASGKPYKHHRDCEPDRVKFYKGFGKRLMRVMKKKHMDSITLAQLTNTSKSCISDYIRGERLPGIYTLSKISKALEVSADELLGIDKVRREINE